MPLAKDVIDEKSEERMLFEALDKGIDDMENGRMVSHEEAIKKIEEYITSYEIQVN